MSACVQDACVYPFALVCCRVYVQVPVNVGVHVKARS